jgi:hypothetical protein
VSIWTLDFIAIPFSKDMEKTAQKYGVKVLHQFHSGLEHTFLWVVEADNAHLIEHLMARTAGRFNTIKIVPLVTFQELIERCKQIEEGIFFSDAAAEMMIGQYKIKTR